MIVQLTGTLLACMPTYLVLDVSGVGYELRCSVRTADAMPEVGTAGVTVFCRMSVSENAISLFGFASESERALFDKIVQVSGIGPSLALSILSTFSPQAFASVVASGDASRLTSASGVGKKIANRLMVEMQSAFDKDDVLRQLASDTSPETSSVAAPVYDIEHEVAEALLSMGFTSQEVQVALDGYEEAGATTVEKAVAYALKRLGGGA